MKNMSSHEYIMKKSLLKTTGNSYFWPIISSFQICKNAIKDYTHTQCHKILKNTGTEFKLSETFSIFEKSLDLHKMTYRNKAVSC